ncbi:MAG: hypothetical protein KBD01_19320 [Acidobacteria bacterium]|nr:hypothetical protein [Acidobacteriota bacterium]
MTFRSTPRRSAIVLAVALGPLAALAYTPGSGTVYSANFQGALDDDWVMGDNVASCPWTQVADGGDTSLYADGRGSLPGSPTLHWAQHFLHPVPAVSFSVAFEYRAELGAGYGFDIDLIQRGTQPRAHRLHVNGAGMLFLLRTENGAFVQKAQTASGVIPANQKRWIRFAVATDISGQHLVRVRAWSGSATAEPSTWNLTYTDELQTTERISRFELRADGPRGIETWVDDLDAFGDTSAGVPSSVTEIYLVEWSHLDIGFTEPPDEIEVFAKTHLDQVLANLAADPNYRWTIEEAWFLDRWWERSSEAERQNMVGWLATPRLKLAAGYASLHSTAAGHEELTRSIYWASRFAREHGVTLRTWITDDVPGTSFALPEILARSGLEYFVGGMNTSFGGAVDLPNHGTRPFWWVGPDGSRVLSWISFDGYAEAFNWGFSFFDSLANVFENTGRELPELEEAGYPYPVFMLMRAFDNHYQGFKARDLVNQWNATYQTPKFRLSTPEEFFDHMLATYGAGSFPSFTGDWGAAWSLSHAGTPHTTRMVREAHRDGRAAEALLACAGAVDGQAVPRADVERMYRRMLEVDEHSGAGAWPGYFTPEEVDRNNRIHLGYAQDAHDTSRSLLGVALGRLAARVPAAGDAIAVFNALGRSRGGWVRVALPADLYATSFRVVDRASGTELPYQRFDATLEILFRAAAVPAIGYRLFDLVPGVPTVEPGGVLAVTPTTVENDFYRVTVSATDGSVTSIVEKATGRELVDAGSAYRFNQLASNTHSETVFGTPPLATPVSSAAMSVVADGPLVAELRVTRTGTPHVQSAYRLYRGEDRVEIENVIDRDRVPYVPNEIGTRNYFVTLPFDVHEFQIRTETTTRFLDPTSDGFQRSAVFDWHNIEHVMQFWDQGGGVLYGVDATEAHAFEMLRIFGPPAFSTGDALLLSRLYDRSDEVEFEGGAIGPFTMEPDTGPILDFTHHFRATPAAFDPVAASSFGWNALNPLRGQLVRGQAGDLPGAPASFFSVDAPGVLLYTVKDAEVGGGIVLRMTELTGAETVARVSSDLLQLGAPLRVEQDEDGGVPLALEQGSVVVPLGPYETATVRVQVQFGAEVSLSVAKDEGAGVVRLNWYGGLPPYSLRRAIDPRFTQEVTTLLDEQAVTTHDDPVLGDGRTYFYLVE